MDDETTTINLNETPPSKIETTNLLEFKHEQEDSGSRSGSGKPVELFMDEQWD